MIAAVEELEVELRELVERLEEQVELDGQEHVGGVRTPGNEMEELQEEFFYLSWSDGRDGVLEVIEEFEDEEVVE